MSLTSRFGGDQYLPRPDRLFLIIGCSLGCRLFIIDIQFPDIECTFMNDDAMESVLIRVQSSRVPGKNVGKEMTGNL